MCLLTLDEEPSLHESPVPSYRFVCGAADGEGGGVARFCHLQARTEIIVKSQLPIPDGQTQELTLGEAGWTLSRCPGCSCGTEPTCPLALVGAVPYSELFPVPWSELSGTYLQTAALCWVTGITLQAGNVPCSTAYPSEP